MAQNLDSALKAVQEIVGRVAGVRAAPEYATDKVPQGIWSMVFPVSGVYTQEPQGVLKGLHSIGLYVYAPRLDLQKTLKQIIPLGDKVAAALENNPTLDSTVSTFGEIQYEFNAALNVGTGTAPAFVAGWTFTLTGVKIQDEL
jgi:hypothetical protein